MRPFLRTSLITGGLLVLLITGMLALRRQAEPQPQAIVFSSGSSFQGFDFYRIYPDGTGLRRLTDQSASDAVVLGNWLVFREMPIGELSGDFYQVHLTSGQIEPARVDLATQYRNILEGHSPGGYHFYNSMQTGWLLVNPDETRRRLVNSPLEPPLMLVNDGNAYHVNTLWSADEQWLTQVALDFVNQKYLLLNINTQTGEVYKVSPLVEGSRGFPITDVDWAGDNQALSYIASGTIYHTTYDGAQTEALTSADYTPIGQALADNGEWIAMIEQDVLYTLHLPSGQIQPIHTLALGEDFRFVEWQPIQDAPFRAGRLVLLSVLLIAGGMFMPQLRPVARPIPQRIRRAMPPQDVIYVRR